LALGAAAAAMIQGVDRQPLGNELLGDPFVLAAVRVESMRDDDHCARLARRLPLAREDLEAVDALEASFSHDRISSCSVHRRNVSGHLRGFRIGAPLSFARNTTNFAGADPLAFRLTRCTSSAPS